MGENGGIKGCFLGGMGGGMEDGGYEITYQVLTG